ncbi:MAG TPA: hypothetical protein VHA33_11550 [Candidatus Angelobacter sp.]|jgi:hypothetical protein|nr:hypothetical protein [Candidatus Angelobacter sp.]
MFTACILLVVAILGGTALTFVYAPREHFATRICMGAATGLALMATIGFLLASFLGMTRATVVMGAGFLALPLLLLLNRSYRSNLLTELKTTLRSFLAAVNHPNWTKSAYFVFYLLVALLLGLVFGRAVFEKPDGIYTGLANNLGDLPMHMQVINSFTEGHNFPVQDPTYAGVRFTYPLLSDVLSAMLVKAGATIGQAMWLQGVILALAMTGLMHSWTLSLTGSRLAGFIAALLLIFSGGLGWWQIFQDVRNSESGLFPLLANLPHDYTIMSASIFRWGNSLTSLFVPQRSFLLGLPLAILIFHQWWSCLNSSSTESQPPAAPGLRCGRKMAAAGVCAGLLPLIHAHSFIVVFGAAAGLAILFRAWWRDWLLFFGIAVAVALPEVVWLSYNTGISAQKYLGWQWGWDRANDNAFWFWFVNTGFFIPLLIAAIFWRRSGYQLPRRLLIFYLPFVLFFIVPNVMKLAPWIWDNIKVLFYWYVASVPLVAYLLDHGLKQRSRIRWIAAGLLATLLLSGALDILRISTNTIELREFNRDGIATAKLIAQLAPPQAVVLHAPVFDSPVFLTGRRSLLGFTGWIWSRGLDYSQRELDIRKIYAGGPDATALLERYHIDYALIGPQERSFGPVNEEFWSHYPLMSRIGIYQLYKIERGR